MIFNQILIKLINGPGLKTLYGIAYIMTEMLAPIHSDEDKTSPQVRGQRLESMRRMMRLSRRQFFEKYKIPTSSLQNWEEGRGYGITEKAARRVITSLKSDGITCSFEWLMYGFGPSPQLAEVFESKHQPILEEQNQTKEKEFIARELAVFYKNYPESAIDTIIADDGMEPRFVKGEFVAGCKFSEDNFSKLIGLDCILQLKNGECLVRIVKNINDDNTFTLSCMNPSTTVERPTLYNVEVLSAAPVLWARRSRS